VTVDAEPIKLTRVFITWDGKLSKKRANQSPSPGGCGTNGGTPGHSSCRLRMIS
jgi:hypothetical protein